MKRLVKVAMALVLGVLVISGTNAQQSSEKEVAQKKEYGKQYRSEFRHRQHNPMFDLNLTDEQKEKIKELHLNVQKETLSIRNQIGENRAKLKTLQTSESPDMKAIDKVIDENAKLMAEIQKKRAANHQEVRKLLTEEQRVIFDSRASRRGFERGKGRLNRGRDHRNHEIRQHQKEGRRF